MTTVSDEMILRVDQEIAINAKPETAFDSLLYRLGEGFTIPGGDPMPMVLEAKPGGRWYRDLGADNGHLWGHVQVIKQPSLIECCGPMFMSYPAINHIQFRVTQTNSGCLVTMLHQAIGLISEQHRQGVSMGWENMLNGVKEHAERN